jgi:hypothetical protein
MGELLAKHQYKASAIESEITNHVAIETVLNPGHYIAKASAFAFLLDGSTSGEIR